ncbi:MAG: energy transducer TonB [Vicinamibacteria bacterium]|nr:energy transducer TonB [Vicinamibacteria bacterium]
MLKKTAAITLLSLVSPSLRAQTPTPSPVPTAQTPVDAKVAGQEVPVPARKKYVAPEYPAAAAAEGVRGIVILDVVISEDGKVESTRVSRSVPGLDEAAMAAVKMWEYEPTRLAGKPVKVRLSQSITFALKLPALQRAPGIPELKSGGAPTAPIGLTAAETASVMVALGTQGEVREAAVVEGNAAVGEALLRAVKAWRFAAAESSSGLVFTIRADWAPGPPPAVTLKAVDPKNATAAAAAAPAPAPQTPSSSQPANAGLAAPPETAGRAPVPAPPAAAAAATPEAPAEDTDVIPVRQEPPPKEQGASAITDVLLGDNIPELVRGRRPVWPPMARLGNVAGDVVVRFSVDLAGKVTVHTVEGPDLLKTAAEQAVASWLFRRTAIDRVPLIATFKFGPDRTFAKVERVAP